MLACLCVCVLACLLVCLCVCLLACLCVCVLACLFVCLLACLCVCVLACLLVCLCVCLLVCLCVCVSAPLVVPRAHERDRSGERVAQRTLVGDRRSERKTTVVSVHPFSARVAAPPERRLKANKQTNKQAGGETDAPAERAHPEDLGDADGAADGERALVHVRAHRGRRDELAHAPLRTGRRAYGPLHRMMRTVISG